MLTTLLHFSASCFYQICDKNNFCAYPEDGIEIQCSIGNICYEQYYGANRAISERGCISMMSLKTRVMLKLNRNGEICYLNGLFGEYICVCSTLLCNVNLLN